MLSARLVEYRRLTATGRQREFKPLKTCRSAEFRLRQGLALIERPAFETSWLQVDLDLRSLYFKTGH